MHFVGGKFVLIIIGEFMERLAVCSGLISLLFLISYPSAFAGGQHGFAIKVFTSPDDQFWNNSVVIEGTHEVMLVDAQLTKTSASRLPSAVMTSQMPTYGSPRFWHIYLHFSAWRAGWNVR
jgi:hypothetical protein